jgi:hypothetical protein
MNKPLALAFGGSAVLVAAIALVVQMKQKDEPTPAAPVVEPTERPTAPITRPGSSAVVTEGSHPKPTGDPEEATEPLVREVDGKIIRDHRKNPTDSVVPPTIRRPGSHQIASTVTHDITQKMVKVLNACATAVPEGSRGPKPRAEGKIVVSIKDKQVAITKATVKLRDVEGDVVEPTQRCIEEKSVGLTTSAKDEADVENYEISISFALL